VSWWSWSLSPIWSAWAEAGRKPNAIPARKHNPRGVQERHNRRRRG
jgi:hypothetical protein